MLRLALLAGIAVSFSAQVYRPGPQVLTFLSDIDGTDQPYALYLPAGFDPAKTYPLVISLHAAGSNHHLNLRRVLGRGNLARESAAEPTRYLPEVRDAGYIVACPLARGSMVYQGIAERDVYEVLADVERRFPIDQDRVYLTGVSSGGGGSLWLGLTRPDVWAAIAPVCAIAPPGARDLAPNALNLPVELFQGEMDPLVPAESSRDWQRVLLEAGAPVEYVEYPGVRHNAWDFAYRNGAIFNLFSRFRRNRWPERVRFETRQYRYDRAYWARLDGLTPGTPASIDARFTAGNRVEIETRNLDGFTLEPQGHPMYSPRLPLILRIDGETLRRAPRAPLSFSRSPRGWRAGKYVPPPGNKRPGAEGPMAEAISTRHLYVYGTADDPGPDEIARRKRMADYAAEWSTSRERLFVSFSVKADRDVTGGDLEAGNLVLFGTRATNSLIRRFAAQFPIALNPGAADYGLVFVAPLANGHYAVVNSGLPWWTGAEDAQRAGPGSMPPAFRVLESFQDYVFFKGGLTDVISEGLFDRDWKLPAEAARKLESSGAIMLQ